LEWPEIISQPSALEASMNSTDIFPTLASIIGASLPDRPIDGIDLSPYFSEEKMTREKPMMFWNGSPRADSKDLQPYLDTKLQEGTSPMVKLMNGKATRDFKNFVQTDIISSDFQGPRAIIDHHYKLVLSENKYGEIQTELFNLRSDPAETTNLKSANPELVEELALKLRTWQESVLNSLLGNDYNKIK
jgi:arylsulfatase A-like enzyme